MIEQFQREVLLCGALSNLPDKSNNQMPENNSVLPLFEHPSEGFLHLPNEGLKQWLLIWVPSKHRTCLFLGNHNFTRNSLINSAWIVNLATFSEKFGAITIYWVEQFEMSWSSFSPLFPSLTPRAADPLWFRWPIWREMCPMPIKWRDMMQCWQTCRCWSWACEGGDWAHGHDAENCPAGYFQRWQIHKLLWSGHRGSSPLPYMNFTLINWSQKYLASYYCWYLHFTFIFNQFDKLMN